MNILVFIGVDLLEYFIKWLFKRYSVLKYYQEYFHLEILSLLIQYLKVIMGR